MFDESATAKYGSGLLLVVRLIIAFASVVTVSSFAAWKVTEPLAAETVLVDSIP